LRKYTFSSISSHRSHLICGRAIQKKALKDKEKNNPQKIKWFSVRKTKKKIQKKALKDK